MKSSRRILGIWVLFLGALAGGCSVSVESCLEDLSSKDPEDRMDAAVALGEKEAGSAVEALADRLARDEWPLVRAACARALVRIGERKSVEALVRALDDKDSMVRWEAVMGIGRFGAREEAARIDSLLKRDPSPEVRRECAKVLGLLGAVEHIPGLIEALKDRDATVRLHSEQSLRLLTYQDLGPVAADWKTWYEDFRKRMELEPG